MSKCRITLGVIFILVIPAFIFSATITGGTICVNGDDATEIWINGHSMGDFAINSII